ncbi:MAG: vWA domain-containing protein [Niastella sp.]|uniref:vWA domain-containing protein n=1 Tax=Niastella sp. TaxID=1869183 RepID=UPI003899824A
MLYNWFEHITFAYPEVFGLFVLIPAMLYWYLNKYDRKQGALKVSSLAVIRKSSSWKSTFRHAPFVIRLLAVCCIIMAMARPQTRNDEELKNGQGIDIILCLDVSGSMLAQDFLPDRLEASKNMAAAFVDMRPTDRIGVVIFSGESFTLVPLTTDKTVLKTQIFNINRGLLEDGTAIGDGLGVSVDRLKSVKTKSKVIILLTDGEDQGGRIDPLAGKELAKAYGIRVYTIGVGSEGYAPVPTADGTRQQKVNIDENLLRMIATETGGLYFRARDNESLKNIYLEIDKLEKSRIEVTSLKRYTERFFPFAFAAAALMFLEIFLRYTLFKKFP